MGISLILLACGFLLTITGVVLFVTRKQLLMAAVFLIVGIVLIIGPPLLVVVNTM